MSQRCPKMECLYLLSLWRSQCRGRLVSKCGSGIDLFYKCAATRRSSITVPVIDYGCNSTKSLPFLPWPSAVLLARLQWIAATVVTVSNPADLVREEVVRPRSSSSSVKFVEWHPFSYPMPTFSAPRCIVAFLSRACAFSS